ncbi:unnamed protein product [Parascedosporium putredinis]|uniref:Major facilitator superfamily (MFS) profile domain-containing protein n=1 Tax=Parascedosporium putredinis TaxID=1442378 RepID=A0A9P1ME02_9PEZI|nr:unnamed protein product [Parascedosporium putredinis]CAI8004704.1 unnamed protein product [Parascedosporium putredinis]
MLKGLGELKRLEFLPPGAIRDEFQKESPGTTVIPEENSAKTRVDDVPDAANEKSSLEQPRPGSSLNEKAASTKSETANAAENGEEEDTSSYLTGAKLMALIGSLCLVIFLVALDQTIIAPALGAITAEFQSVKDIGWYGSAYFLTTTALQPMFGNIYKRFNIKWAFLGAVFIFEVGSLICAVAKNSTTFIVGRAIAGIGTAGMFSGGIIILANSMPLRQRPLAFGVISSMWGIASVAGPLLDLPIGGLAMVAIFFILNIKRNNNPENISFIRRVLQLDLPAPPSLYFQAIKGDSAVQAGIKLIPLLLAVVISSMIGGGLITYIGYYNPVVIPCMVLATVGAGMLTTLDVDSPLREWFGYQVLCGLGIGPGFQVGVLVIQTIMSMDDVPVATACVQFGQALGGAVFIAVAQTLFQNGLIDEIQAHPLSNGQSINPLIFINSGASEVRTILESQNLGDTIPMVLEAYMTGLRNTFYISVAGTGIAFFLSLALSWKSIKGKGASPAAV